MRQESGIRQVNRDELAYAIAEGLRRTSRSTLKMLLDSRHRESRMGRAMAALEIAKGLAHFEILSDRDLPPLMGEGTYSRPIARMLGEDAPSGATRADETFDQRD